jgi:hypothetical protein
VSVSTNDVKENVKKESKEEVKKESTVKMLSKRFCVAQSGKDDDPSYHLCGGRINHEGKHKCCACKATW